MRLEVDINDWMDILCPHKANYDRASNSNKQDLLYLELYNVTKEQYQHCSAHSKLLLLYTLHLINDYILIIGVF